jgi:hypothetical protein
MLGDFPNTFQNTTLNRFHQQDIVFECLIYLYLPKYIPTYGDKHGS